MATTRPTSITVKLNVYDHDTRIPLIISGPGIHEHEIRLWFQRGCRPDHVCGSVTDEIPEHFDGKSILNVLDLDESVLLPWTRCPMWSTEKQVNGTPSHWYIIKVIELVIVDDMITNTYRALLRQDIKIW